MLEDTERVETVNWPARDDVDGLAGTPTVSASAISTDISTRPAASS